MSSFGMVTVITDDDVRRLLGADRAVAWMREALIAEHLGELHSPPRLHADLGEGRLVFTTGALDGRWFGFRAYDTFDLEPGDQVVVVHDAATGRVRGIAVGNELGPRRVGAIGGVAADTLARPDSRSLAVVGTGAQAWQQLRAISAVRDLAQVRVFSPTVERREAFAARARSELDVDATPTSDAHDAVDGADMVVLATSSPTPVVDSDWIGAGSYVATLGPKQVGRSEFGPKLVTACDAAFTDSVAQIEAYDPPSILAGTPYAHGLTSLGAVLAGDSTGRTSDEQRLLFCSVGLAGTEVFLLDRLLTHVGASADSESRDGAG